MRVTHPQLVEALRTAGLPTLGAWARSARVSWTRFGVYRKTGHVPAKPLQRLADAMGVPAPYVLAIITLPLGRGRP